MKKTFIALLSLIAFFSMSFVLVNKTEPLYKNLKVLPKNITKEQMDSVMHSFSGALNVRCGFCHSYNEQLKSMDFASDAKKEKETARDMWRMTAKLNKKYFEVKNSRRLDAPLEVTCFTCHRGSEHPATK